MWRQDSGLKCRKQNRTVLLNVITSNGKSLQMLENWGQKFKISSESLGMCVDKRSGGCKISSQYFSKMLSILRHRPNDPSLIEIHFKLA